jgi:hypothetical protein
VQLVYLTAFLERNNLAECNNNNSNNNSSSSNTLYVVVSLYYPTSSPHCSIHGTPPSVSTRPHCHPSVPVLIASCLYRPYVLPRGGVPFITMSETSTILTTRRRRRCCVGTISSRLYPTRYLQFIATKTMWHQRVPGRCKNRFKSGMHMNMKTRCCHCPNVRVVVVVVVVVVMMIWKNPMSFLQHSATSCCPLHRIRHGQCYAAGGDDRIDERRR